MNETLQLIDQLIAEHKAFIGQTASIEKAANDTALLARIREAKGSFPPDQAGAKDSLKKVLDMVQTIKTALNNHFNREETILLPAVQKLNIQKLIDALETRLFEHTDLRERLLLISERVDELIYGKLAANIWESSYKDTQTYMEHTWKLLTTHAGNENRFFADLRKALQKTGK